MNKVNSSSSTYPKIENNIFCIKKYQTSRVKIGDYFVDSNFVDHFRNLKQVFLYITDQCNNYCEQCIYKPSVNRYFNPEIELSEALRLLKTFRSLGASKVTFLGGEPSLYGLENNNQPLFDLIKGTREIGYKYIRLDTNGLAVSHLFPQRQFEKLDEIAFSLDGFSPSTNDCLRGTGTFKKIVESIKESLSYNYRTTITCCAHQRLVSRDRNHHYNIEKMIRFAENLGVSQINFHDLFKTGVPMDTWTGNFAPSPHDWVDMFSEISEKIKKGAYNVGIRLPQCFVTEEIFESNPKYYGYCPAKLGERVMVHPNGIIRICSNMICTNIGTAKYMGDKIIWDNSCNNELQDHKYEDNTPCTNRSRHKNYHGLVPLCFSFKPGQDEYVWKNELSWDKYK